VHGFISREEEENLLEAIDHYTWDSDLKRKVQQHGYRFDHQSQNLKAYLGPLPTVFDFVTDRLVEQGLYPHRPDQMIINHYTPGQGIFPHVDKTHCFDGVVGSVGLGSSCIMQFRPVDGSYSGENVDVFFPRRAAVVLSGDSRYKWTHGIPARTSDTWQNADFKRKTRISLTWRTVILTAKDQEKVAHYWAERERQLSPTQITPVSVQSLVSDSSSITPGPISTGAKTIRSNKISRSRHLTLEPVAGVRHIHRRGRKPDKTFCAKYQQHIIVMIIVVTVAVAVLTW